MRRLGDLLVICGCVIGCSGGGEASSDGGVSVSEGGSPADGGSSVDAGLVAADGSADAGGVVDAGARAEVCSGGVDEDRDLQFDCADADCWTDPACMLADVSPVAPGAMPCGDPIEIDEAASAAACAAIGTPMGSMYATDCASGSATAMGYLYCDADGSPVALWLEERITTPRAQEMLGARRFRTVSFERQTILDWERQVSGPTSREGGVGFPAHDTRDFAPSGDRDAFRTITIRAVRPGDTISRLLGLTQITSLIDLDAPMSMDTRDARRLGGLTLTIPAL